MRNGKVKNMVLAAMFLGIGQVLPFVTGQIPQVGKMLSPMHIPILLCGLICGWKYGLIVGAVCPLMRAVLFGMPALFPNAVGMSFELAAYGAVIGFLYQRVRRQNIKTLYLCLITAMLAGRLVWGLAQIVLLGLTGSRFTLQMFLAGGFINAVPGIILQLILIPAVMLGLHRAKLVPFRNREGKD